MYISTWTLLESLCHQHRIRRAKTSVQSGQALYSLLANPSLHHDILKYRKYTMLQIISSGLVNPKGKRKLMCTILVISLYVVSLWVVYANKFNSSYQTGKWTKKYLFLEIYTCRTSSLLKSNISIYFIKFMFKPRLLISNMYNIWRDAYIIKTCLIHSYIATPIAYIFIFFLNIYRYAWSDLSPMASVIAFFPHWKSGIIPKNNHVIFILVFLTKN